MKMMKRGLPIIMYAPRLGERGRSSLLYISIVYFMQKACKIVCVLNGGPQMDNHSPRRMWIISGSDFYFSQCGCLTN